MNYNKIRTMDISNGPGIRLSIFVQGCTFNCKNCFNPETHNFNGGKPFTQETINKIIELSKPSYIKGLSILGGEPLHPNNIFYVTELARIFKKYYPEKDIWLWTGFTYENYVRGQEILNYIDVLVDGQFDENLYDPKLKFRGSSNQRIIYKKDFT